MSDGVVNAGSDHRVIRSATADDADDIASIHRAAILRGCVGDYSPTQIRAWVSLISPARYLPLIAERYFRVALDDGAVCGFASTTTGDDLLHTLYVAPFAFNQGVGTALVADAEEALRTAGRHEAQLHATLNAVEFFHWLGYVDAGPTTRRLTGGVALACMGMRKPLD